MQTCDSCRTDRNLLLIYNTDGKLLFKVLLLHCYMSDPKLEMYKDAIQYGKKHHLPVYLISYGWVPEGMKAIRPNGVEEFISLVSNAHTVFTASYHGMLFSLYFNRNFYYYNRGWKERMKSIAEYLQLCYCFLW